MTEAELERIRLYGLCPAHGVPLDVRRTSDEVTAVRTNAVLEMFCPSCDQDRPFVVPLLI